MTDDSNARCRRGRPFAKGQSGNPGGRPKMPEELKDAMRGLADKAVEVLREAMKCDDPRVRVMAATAALDRGYGRPAQTVNAKIEGVDIAEAHLQALQAFTQSGNTAERAANLLTLAAGATTTEH
jgi:uncharacterized protein DUF5681